MRWIIALITVGLLLLGGLVFAIALVQPELVRVVVGLSSHRLWLFGAGLAGGLLLLALIVVYFSKTRGVRTTAGLTGVILAAAITLFLLERPDYPVIKVSYPGADITLVGDLYLPTSPPPHPAVVLVHGSAPFPRTFYDLWADHLARQGVAVLLADKRGVGESGGQFESNNNGSRENLERLAGDVVAGIQFLAGRAEIDSSRLGLYGISQGGWVGVLATRQEPQISFLIMNVGPTVSVGEEGVWSDLRGDDTEEAILSLAEAEQVIRDEAPSGYDPRPDLARVAVQGIPGLWQFGDADNSIPSQKSARQLDELIAAGATFEYRMYPGAGHILITGFGGDWPPRIARQSWLDLDQWLADRVLH
jgi:dienelactone hydrolase